MISKSEVDAIRERADIVRIIASYGHDLRKTGKSFKCCCPFHEERSPSFDVDPERKTFKCFGCGAGPGDVFRFIMLKDRLKFPEAVRKVAQIVGFSLSGGNRGPMRVEEGGQQSGGDRAERTFQRFSKPNVFDLSWWRPFAAAFQASSWAKIEAQGRGLTMEVCKAAMLGWQDNGRKMCPPDERYENFIDKPWIGFPYIWGDKVRLVKWRPAFSVGKTFIRPSGMEDVLFIDGPPDPLEDVFLVEGEVDALTIRMIDGFRACSVPSGFQSKIPKAMRDYLLGFRKVYACVDNDPEGQMLLRRLLLDFPAEKLDVVTIPEEFKDANGLLMKGCEKDPEVFLNRFLKLVDAARRPTAVAFMGAEEAFDAYIARLRQQREETFWEWPWPNVQRMAIIKPGQVLSLASDRSGIGSTTLAIQAAMYNALHTGRKVGYYTAEVDPVDEMVPILTAQMTNTDRNELREGDVERAKYVCRNAEFYLGYDPDARGWDDVKELFTLAVKRLGIDVFVIDHLDYIIRDPDFSKQNALKSLATRWLKVEFARKYGVLVLILKKRGGKPDKREKRKGDDDPDVYDQSGLASQIEDVDHAFMMKRAKRAKLSEEDGEDIYENMTKLFLGKSRRKGKGASVASLMFQGKMARFVCVDRQHEEPVVEPPAQKLPYKDN